MFKTMKALSIFALNSAVVLSGFAMAGCSHATPASETQTVAASTPVEKGPVLPATLAEAVTSGYRTSSNTVRDGARHPLATLNFFGIKNDMTVVEISPGAGWYAEILAPFLAAHGHYVAAAVPVTVYEGGQAFLSWMQAHPEVAANAKVVDFVPPKSLNLGPENSADLVLTFRNVHNWMKSGSQDAVFKSFFKVLKPGGTLGVVEHRQKESVTDSKATSGYVRTSDLIKMAKRAGFQLVEQSEINANPKDTKDYPEGVWTLPPTYALGDKDHAKYQAIGESDRMTLKFVKPGKATSKKSKK